MGQNDDRGPASCKGVSEIRILDSTISLEGMGHGEMAESRGRISQRHITMTVVAPAMLWMIRKEGGGESLVLH